MCIQRNKAVLRTHFKNIPRKILIMSAGKNMGPPVTPLKAVTSIDSPDYDSLVLVASPDQNLSNNKISSLLKTALDFDPSLKSEAGVIALQDSTNPKKPQKLIYSPTGPIDADYDDVRILKTCAFDGIKRALASGSKKPLLILEEHPIFDNGGLVMILGALQALYTPIQVREHDPSKTHKVEYLGVWTNDENKTNKLISLANILESGRRVACDIGDSDPERMTPIRVEEYITSIFSNSSIKLEVISDIQKIEKEFPLFEAVNRAASAQERHRGRLVFMKYEPPETPRETLFFVGKGVTYDSGGIDVKFGMGMVGMSRDKCGAAAVTGFMQVVNQLKPKNIKVIGGVGMVRNSIGSNGYVSDEVITARSGARVRVINTDAEGRMVMGDILCRFKEEALSAINPHLFTVATLTGHASLTVGEGYSIVVDNGPAFKAKNYRRLLEGSERIGDPFDTSTLRKDDFVSHRGVMEGDDIIQGGAKPSSQTPRGHQGPAAFLLLVSGLDKHGSGSSQPIKFSHLDIAGSAGDLPNPGTGSPVLALYQTYLV